MSAIFLYRKSRSFWVRDTELQDKDKSIVSTLSVFLVDKYAVITT